MKRLIFIVVALSICCALHAQVGVTADLSFGCDKYSFTRGGVNAFDKTLPQGSSFRFSPRVSYGLKDGVEVGLQLGVGHSVYSYTDGFYDPIAELWRQSQVRKLSQLDLSAGAFVRGQIATFGNLTLHLELLASYGRSYGNVTTTEYDATSMWEVVVSQRCNTGRFDVMVTPVIHYALTEHVGMDAYINALSLSYSRARQTLFGREVPQSYQDPEVSSETVTSHFGVGLNALNTSLITLGVGYSF